MSLSKSKCWYSNNCLQFLKHAVPFTAVTLAAKNKTTNSRRNKMTQNDGITSVYRRAFLAGREEGER